MSTNAYGDDKGAAQGAGAGALSTVPKLRTGGYVAWRPDMEVHLSRCGADGAHKRKLEKEHWLKLVAQVQAWHEEAMAEALADIGIGSGESSSGSSTPAKAPLTEREQATRKTIRAMVEQSTKAYGAIWAALPEELRAQAAKGGEVPQNFAYGLWTWLEHKFQSTETDSIGELLAQWIALQQEEDESFDAYRARVNHLRALLLHAKEPPSDNMYAFMLLDRLQPRYKQAVLALKAGNQLADAAKIAWDTVTAFINAHERSEQRIGGENGGAGGAAMASAARSNGSRAIPPEKPTHHRQGSHNSWSTRSSDSATGGSGPQARSSTWGGGSPRDDRRQGGTKDWRTCFRCNKRGHVAAVCKMPPKADSDAASEGHSARKRDGELASAAVQGATRNRFEALSSDDDDSEQEWPTLPQRVDKHTDVSSAQAAASTLPGGRSMAAAKPDGVVTQPVPVGQSVTTERAQSAPQMELDVELSNSAWGWDTMASSCCSGNRARFAALRRCAAVPVKVADGSIVEVTHIGSVPLRVRLDNGRVVRIVLDDVLYHKRFASNLLSGELLTSEGYGWQYHSSPQGTFVLTPGGDRVTLSRRGRVSVLMSAEPELQRAQSVQGTGSQAGSAQKGQPAAVEQLVRLHERLNHMGWTRMLFTLRSGRVEGLGVDLSSMSKDTVAAAEKHVRECTACIKGRATRTPFGHRGLDRGTAPGECLHMDSYPVKFERDGRLVTEHGLVVKCMHSGYVWHGQLQTKDQVPPAVMDLVRRMETQFGRVAKRLYADGGSEFKLLKDFLAKHGKQLLPSPPRTQQLNGGAERTVRTFKDYERTMVIHAGAPVRFWGRAGAHAAFVWNRAHISKETGMTPYEAMRGKKPSMRHLGVWGCDAFCHVPKELRDGAMAPKAEPCIYLGHNEAQNATNVLLLSSRKMICSRDVTFRSDSFTFMRALDRGGDDLGAALADADRYVQSEADDGRLSDAAQGGVRRRGRRRSRGRQQRGRRRRGRGVRRGEHRRAA